jgi:NAD(P)-dependent dehydrogenase (short-subunit alcohol dehydrogenase family)
MTAIEGSVALVTGANGGLGTEFVAQLLERGAAKVYAAARAPRTWTDPRVVPLLLDVTDPASIAAAAREAADTAILVNNAGILRRGDLLTAPIADIRAQMDTNLFGPLETTRAFADALIRGGGAVVNVASVLSWLPIGKGYGLSKAALWSATNALRLELAPAGVHVLGAYLAFTDTPMNDGLSVRAMNRPDAVVRQILDGLAVDADEVLADETTRAVRARLAGPPRALLGDR